MAIGGFCCYLPLDFTVVDEAREADCTADTFVYRALGQARSLRNVCDAEVVAELRQTVSVDGINLLKLLHDGSVCTLCVNALEAIIFIGEESGMF